MAKGKKSKAASPKKKGGAFHGKLWLSGVLIFVLAVGTGVSFIPERVVPAWAMPVYDTCLIIRNTAIAQTGLQVSRFEDTAVVKPEESPEIHLYFSPSPNIEAGLCEFIRSAEGDLDVCIFDLDLASVSNELIAAAKRGVQIRVVVDSDNRKLSAVDKISSAKIPVVEDNRSAVMHHKFMVADSKRVWTGSFNFTENGKNLNDNNAVIVESPVVAEFYSRRFEEYFSGRFGTAAAKSPVLHTFIGKVPVSVCFSPEGGTAQEILRQLSYAKKSIYVMAFVLTNDAIAKELGVIAKKGVDVHVLLDRGQATSRFSDNQYLHGCGVHMAISPNKRGKMHHKVMVIDEETVLTGSYNFSDNAEHSNDENLIIIKNTELAGLFVREYKRCSSGTKGY